MVDRVRDQVPEGRDAGDPPESGRQGRPDRSSEDHRVEGPALVERRKAETEIAAGDVADDLADFA